MKNTIKDGAVNLREKVTVYGTGKSVYMPSGKTYEVHPLHAKTLVENGLATEKRVKME